MVQQSDEIIQQAKRLLEMNGKHKSSEMALCYSIEGEINYKKGELQKTIECLEQSVKIIDYEIENAQNDEHKAILFKKQSAYYENLGNLHCDLRNYDQAKQFLEIALKGWQEIEKEKPKSILHIKLLNSIGQFHISFLELDKGLNYLLQAKAALEPLESFNADFYAWVLLCLSRFFTKSYNYALSGQYLQESIEVQKNFKISHNTELQILEHQGNLQYTSGKYELSMETFQKGLQMMKQNNILRDPLYIRFLYCTGQAHVALKQYQEALTVSKESYQIAEEVFGEDDEQTADALRVMGLANYSIGEQNNQQSSKNLAIQQLKRAADITESISAKIQDADNILQELAHFQEKENAFKDAVITLERLRRLRTQMYNEHSLEQELKDKNISEIDKKIQELYININHKK